MNTIQAELLPLSWSVTSKGGAKIVFQVSSEEELELFKGLEGKRLQGVFAAIGDDETPVPAEPKIKPTQQKLSQVAALMCKNEEFQKWCRLHYPVGNPMPENPETLATEFIYEVCKIESRADLDCNNNAADYFHNFIRKPFTERQQ